MSSRLCAVAVVLAIGSLAAGCAGPSSSRTNPTGRADRLIGAWRTKVTFTNGAFADIKDLEFMYVFNAGGTMTESSNYDGAPPVPPAYGEWKKTGPHTYEARYSFYVTKAPANIEEITKGGGWLPVGHGVLVEKITLSKNGRSYQSSIQYDAFDKAGKPAEGGGRADGHGARL